MRGLIVAGLLAACGSSGGSPSPDGPGPGTPDAPIVIVPPPDAPPVSSCGNGLLEQGEGCEFDTDCTRRQSCSSQCACVALDPPPAETSQVLIDDDYRAGTIDLGTALLYRAYAIYHDPRLPEAYDGVGVDSEDATLALDVARAMPMLSQAELDALTPYLVRPSDPRSIFSVGYSGATAAKTGLGPDDDCPMIVGCKDWQSITSAHFRVWTCGTSAIAEADGVSSDAESLFDPEVTLMGPPEADGIDNVDGHNPTTDIYLVDLYQGRTRNGECIMINDGNDLGITPVDFGLVAAGPGSTSSAYILLQHDLTHRRSVVAHEFFHVLEAAHSIQAFQSWLSESSATWAESHFVRETSGEAVMPRFNGGGEMFLSRVGVRIDRNGHDTTIPNSYEAFIWQYFAEQESGADTIGAIWNATGSARDLDAANSVFPFKTHFKDFILRNINDDSLDSAGLPKYDSLDPMFPMTSSIPLGKDRENLGSLHVGMPTIGALNLDRLAAHYADVGIDGDNIREITFDFSKVSNSGGLDVELLLASDVAETTWRHVSMAGMTKYTLCTETDPPKVYAVKIAIGNHATESNFISGTYQITGKATCCPAGQTCWSGSASVATNIQTPYGTIHGSIQANVQWHALDQDPTGTIFVPTGSATYSASGQSGDCAITLQATTLPITENEGTLQFFPNTTPETYNATGSTAGPAGTIITYHFDCPPPSGSFDLPGDVKPWLLMNGFQMVPPDGGLLAGTYNAADGNSYSWMFMQ